VVSTGSTTGRKYYLPFSDLDHLQIISICTVVGFFSGLDFLADSGGMLPFVIALHICSAFLACFGAG
jgi:hypothetical protein